MSKNKKLGRFHEAQDDSTGGYRQAFSEIQSGRKKSHWIWYIFPQLEHLGQSPSAKLYGIADFNEACDYLKDPILFKRYFELVKLTEEKLENTPLANLMGGYPDDLKFISSLTLFQSASKYLSSKEKDFQREYNDLYETCARVFEQIAQQGYTPCQQTELFIERELRSHNTKLKTEQRISAPKITVFSPMQDKSKLVHPIYNELTQYMNERKNEWNYHYNFLGIAAVLYFIQDLIFGTDHFNSKAREVKLSAASKLQKILDPKCHEQCALDQSEKNALADGRLGNIVNKHGGLDKILATAPEKPVNTTKNQEIKFNPFV